MSPRAFVRRALRASYMRCRPLFGRVARWVSQAQGNQSKVGSYHLGELAIAQEEWAAAVAVLQPLLEMPTGSPPAKARVYAALARAQRGAGLQDAAESTLRLGLDHYPRHRRLLRESAELANERQDWPKAIQYLEAIKGNSGAKCSSRVYVLLARAYCKSRQFQAAEAVLVEGRRIYPKALGLAREVAELATARKDYRSAFGLWQRYSDACGGDPPVRALVRLSTVAFQLDRFEYAESVLEQALEKEPGSLPVLIAIKNQLNAKMRFAWQMMHSKKVKVWEGPAARYPQPNWTEMASVCHRLLDAGSEAQNRRTRRQLVQALLFQLEEELEAGNEPGALAAAESVLDNASVVLDPSMRPDFAMAIVKSRLFRSPKAVEGHRLIAMLKAATDEHQTCEGWLNLYDILTWNGFLLAGLMARRSAARQACTEADASPANVALQARAARVCLESGHLEGAQTYLDRIDGHGVSVTLTNYLRLQEGKVSDVNVCVREPSDAAFYEYIRGKSVAVVGPAPNSLMSGAEIDGFDVVVRFNQLGGGSQGGADTFGARTDVSYFNTGHLRYQSQIKNAFNAQELKFYVFKDLKYEFQERDRRLGRARRMIKADIMFHGVPNAVPAAVFDLFHFSPKRVKVFSTNFFLSRRTHAEGYGDRRGFQLDSPQQLVRLHGVLYLHDLIAQRRFIKSLWESGLLEVDAECASVLRLSDDEYMGEMERIYSDHQFEVSAAIR